MRSWSAGGRIGTTLAAALLLTACTSRRPPPVRPAGTLPWEVSSAELGSERLYRLAARGPQDSSSFRVTLRLDRRGDFDLAAVDPLGRAAWTLRVRGQRALLLDHQQRSACLLPAGSSTEARALAPGLPPLPLGQVAAVLLGVLPVPPAGSAPGRSDEIEFRDQSGRRWSVHSVDGEVVGWTLWEGDQASLIWERAASEDRLSVPREGTVVSWRETARETLNVALTPLAIPRGYAEADCDRDDLP